MEIKIPAVGESVSEALVAKWLRQDGDRVSKDQPVCEIETDKITLELNAEADGVLSIAVAEGTTVPVGTVIASIEEGGEAQVAEETPATQAEPVQKPAAEEKPVAQAEPAQKPAAEAPPLSPAVRKMAQEKGISPEDVRGSGRGGRITVEDLLKAETGSRESGIGNRESGVGGGEKQIPSRIPETSEGEAEGRETRTPLSPIRRRIAERLLAARQQTAMLTTFNEADMTRVIGLKQRHKEDFRRRHGVGLGFMPFFIKATVQALVEYPALNSRIEGNDLVRSHFYDIGIAVSGVKGLVVPVLRDADRLTFADMEVRIAEFVEKVKTNKLALTDLEGGTFSITNGGVYGSLLSTPILNPPQCGVLGMHAIQERPVVRDGEIVIRPMMYLALSYDHRIVDGREAVQFLKRVKELVEEPEDMLLEG